MSLTAFSTGSRQGDARAPGALARLLRSKKLPTSFACGEQIHGTRVATILQWADAKKYKGTDGFLTDRVSQPLAIFTADCVPVFISADHGRVVGLLHGGWRGIQKGIFSEAVRLLRRKWGIRAARISAWAGPHIGPCCFEVQWDVARHFPRSRLRRGYGGQARWTVDLEGELRIQAKRMGVRWLVPRSLGGGAVSKMGFEGCTMHEARFYSYRRDKTPKRQVSVIMKVAARHPGMS